MSQEVWDYIFKAFPWVISGGAAILKLRDMVLNNRDRVKAVEKELAEMRDKREKDLVEYNSLKGIATVIDNKIDTRINAFIQETAKQRHEDSKAFNETLTQIRETLAKIDSTLTHLGSDVERIKNKETHP